MRWNIDPSHSTAEFTVRHLMITNVRGRFGKLAGTVDYDPEHPEQTRISATIDATTIDTHEDKRDAHLRSPDFFDVEKFPTLVFESTTAVKTGDGLELTGNLTMHGVTKAITLAIEEPSSPQKDPWGGTRLGAAATAKVNRKDWGLNWNAALEAGGVLVGEQVKIHLEIQLTADQKS
ncbi:MAG TPA: YceI family protein [Kofleriaceae bacterium]|jgi:polyisoprenoid-binding protein YceI